MNINWIEATLLASAIFLGGLSLGAHATETDPCLRFSVEYAPDQECYHWLDDGYGDWIKAIDSGEYVNLDNQGKPLKHYCYIDFDKSVVICGGEEK